jgi:hypothetical protein
MPGECVAFSRNLIILWRNGFAISPSIQPEAECSSPNNRAVSPIVRNPGCFGDTRKDRMREMKQRKVIERRWLQPT